MVDKIIEYVGGFLIACFLFITAMFTILLATMLSPLLKLIDK